MPIRVDRLVRSARRTIAAEIGKDARLTVRAPRWVSAAAIESFLKEREAWIRKHQSIQRLRLAHAPVRQFREGEQMLFLGRWYPLSIDREARLRLDLHDGQFVLSHFYINEARETFIAWYRDEARREIERRAAKYALAAGLKYHRIRITSASTRWGSCSPANNLSFPWRLVMAPLAVIDSVVVHELVHTEIRDHSRRFWKRVKSLFPGYDEAGRWLDEHEHLLTL